MNKYCLYCNKELEAKGTKLNPIRKFCNHTCSSRYFSKMRYNKLKDNEEYKKKNRERFNNWYKNNKERQKINVLNSYHLNKDKWNQRRFVYRNRKKILKHLNTTCFCGNPVKLISNKNYDTYPTLLRGYLNEEDKNKNNKLIEEFTKKNLVGVCSKICLRKYKNGK